MPAFAVVLWLGATLFWWAFAFMPLPSAPPEWLTAARVACFGATVHGLPAASGWLLLVLAPVMLLAVIIAIAAKSMPFFVVLVRATFMSVPIELEEAAMVDGNSRIGAFFHIVLPLARNGILVSAILIFMQAFGEFVYSKSIIQAIEYQPASVGLYSFMGPNTNEWNNIMAFATMYVTPILALFVLLQRRIVSGLTSGALK